MPKNNLDSHENHQRYKGLVRAWQTVTPLRPGVFLLVLAGLVIAGATQARASAPRLSVDNEIATAGFFRLSWGPDAGSFELQEAADAAFRNASTLYRGNDLATVISGKPDGTWHYRVRNTTVDRHGAWSKPVAVTVSHHELSRALMFLSLGLVVFAAIALTVIRGRSTR